MTRDEVIECITNLGIKNRPGDGAQLIVGEDDLEVRVYIMTSGNIHIYYDIETQITVHTLNDIFDLQDWMIDRFK